MAPLNREPRQTRNVLLFGKPDCLSASIASWLQLIVRRSCLASMVVSRCFSCDGSSTNCLFRPMESVDNYARRCEAATEVTVPRTLCVHSLPIVLCAKIGWRRNRDRARIARRRPIQRLLRVRWLQYSGSRSIPSGRLHQRVARTSETILGSESTRYSNPGVRREHPRP